MTFERKLAWALVLVTALLLVIVYARLITL